VALVGGKQEPLADMAAAAALILRQTSSPLLVDKLYIIQLEREEALARMAIRRG
jgi:hypothetical protein